MSEPIRRRTPGERIAYLEGRLAAMDARLEGLEGEMRTLRMMRRLMRKGIGMARRDAKEPSR